MKYVWIIVGFLVLVAGVSLFVFFQNPANVAWLISAAVSAIASAVLPSIGKAIAPKDLTDEQKAKIRQGQDPFRKREREH